jgi:hypothetical protein
MLDFKKPPRVVEALQFLPEVFVLDDAETSLFTSVDALTQRAGSWTRLLLHLTSSTNLQGSGASCGIQWERGSCPVRLKGNGFAVIRFARWVEIKLGNDILIAAFVPKVYTDRKGKEYADHQFVVGCSNQNIVPLVMLFTDLITGNAEGDNSWEMASQSSTNMD